ASALTYFEAGASALGERGWALHRDLVFALELGRAACELLTSRHEAAEARLANLSARAVGIIDEAAVASLEVELHITLDRAARAAAVSIDFMKKRGVDWTVHPSAVDVRQDYDHVWRLIGDRPIESLLDLPLMDDAAARATMDVLSKFIPAATM